MKLMTRSIYKLLLSAILPLGMMQYGYSQNERYEEERDTKPSKRYQLGWEKLKEIDGQAGEQVIKSLQDISPDLGRFIIEYSFGDIYSRDGLDLKSKEIAVVAALTAMGNAVPQLKVHLNGALNTGSSISEVKEVILQMSAYSGFPSSMNGMTALKEVVEERESQGIQDTPGKDASPPPIKERLRLGVQEISHLDGLMVGRMKKDYGDFSPDLIDNILKHAYGDIFSRDNLSKKHREIATIAALAALGTAQPQLKFHINGGLNIGVSEEEMKEVMLLMTVYAGFPAAINGTNILKEVIAERNERSP